MKEYRIVKDCFWGKKEDKIIAIFDHLDGYYNLTGIAADIFIAIHDKNLESLQYKQNLLDQVLRDLQSLNIIEEIKLEK